MNSTYEELLHEVYRLRKENDALREQIAQLTGVKIARQTRQLSLEEKVALFRGLFAGREDVFARRWFSQATGRGGYQPVCRNEWRSGLCDKQAHKCADCPYRELKPIEYEDVYRHLAGRDALGRDVIGIYPVREDNTCSFLCADFDDKTCEHGYQDDVRAYVAVAQEWGVPCYVERSRSGNGAHVWIFFAEPVPAAQVRKLGYALLTEAMNRRGQISLQSYDRLFPNQDFVEKGGFGNLVALPLQGRARKQGNSVFVDEAFNAIEDQWDYLKNVERMTPKLLVDTIAQHYSPQDMGDLSVSSEEHPWEVPSPTTLDATDFLSPITIVRANMLYVPLKSLSARAVNHLKRIAAFKNPEFFAKRAMHFSTHNVPRIISCASLSEEYIALPRGCEDALCELFTGNGVWFTLDDKTCVGHPVSVEFNGALRPEQQAAMEALLQHNNGILHATTAFGKTVTAIGLIARRQVNTLILVHTKALLDQWHKRLSEFLSIDYSEEVPSGQGRRRKFSPFGKLDSTGNSLHGQVDIALIQSCMDDTEVGVKDFVRGYGMVIVDECHHLPAAQFERLLQHVNARYVYGLTATPIRKDGHQPIIFMQCGPIRYSSTEPQTPTVPRILVPRFTSFRQLDETASFVSLRDKLADDALRNELIVNDTIKAVTEGRTPIILTQLTRHVALWYGLLRNRCDATIVTLVGAEKEREKRLKMALLNELPPSKPLIIIATGKYVGEGFDYPRLDTLMLALPVSWKGLVVQYAGRLHRDYEGKRDVRIYDYVDIHVPLFDLMYRRRMKGYVSIGYKPQSSPAVPFDTQQSLFDSDTYWTPYLNDIQRARQSILLILPKPWLPRHAPLLNLLQEEQAQGISVAIFVQQESPYTAILQAHGFPVKPLAQASIPCASLDSQHLWYGNVNYLAHSHTDDYAIRLNDIALIEEILDKLL